MSDAHEIRFTVAVSPDEVEICERGRYTGVALRNGAIRGNTGEPALPWRRILVAVPLTATGFRVTVGELKASTLRDGIMVEPVQPNVPTLLGTKAASVGPNRKIYQRTEAWPASPVRFVAVRKTGAFAMAELELCPVRLYPASKRLDLIENVEVVLSFKEGAALELLPAAPKTYHSRFAAKVKKWVVNPDDVKLVGVATWPPDSLFPLPIYPIVRHVIITSAAMAGSFRRLADWRTLLGVPSRVVTVEDIVAGTVPNTSSTTFWKVSGYSDGGTRDTAEAIRNFIKWAIQYWGLEYVVLGGDTATVPARQGIDAGVGTHTYGNLTTVATWSQLGYSPSASTEDAGAPASNVLDDNASTVWRCAATDASPWIRVALGSGKPVNRVTLTWNTAHATSYVVQVSQDATTWTDVYSTTAAPGGKEDVTFACVSARFVRVSIASGPAFELVAMAVYGPPKSTAYSFDATTTRLYLGQWLTPNTTTPSAGDQIYVKSGPNLGLVVPYNPACSATNLGWRFVTDLLARPGVGSTSATEYAEILGPAACHGQPFVCKTDVNYIATDLYYADTAEAEYPPSTHHDWDADDNGIYGERDGNADEVNGVADVHIGRVPADTAAHVDIFIDKLINYETFRSNDGFGTLLPTNFAISVLLASQNWFTEVAGTLDWCAVGQENIRKMFLSYDPARWAFTRLYQDANDVPAADQGSDLTTVSAAAIKSAIATGCNVVSLASHGSPGYVCTLINSDVDDEAGVPSLFYGNACSTNKFDTSSGDAIGEVAVLNPNGGAVAYVGNTRYGWTGDSPIEQAYWEALITGERLADSLEAAHMTAGGWGKYSLNLLGDPAMRVWSDRPRQITVSHVSQISTGSQSFKVTVTSGATPVQGALVCASMAGLFTVTSTTNASGLATLTVAPSVPGTMKVGVSGKNLIPYLGSVKVVQGPSTCSSLVLCKSSVFCAKLLCDHRLVHCSGLLGCSMAIAQCKALRPDDFWQFEDPYELFGIPDLAELARRMDEPEIKAKLNNLPLEIRKSMTMMLTQIRAELASVPK